MVNVLHVIAGLSGGVGRMLLNYYSYLDKQKIHFDFVVHETNKTVLEDDFAAMGSVVTAVTPKKQSAIKNFFEIKKAIKKKKYDIVYVHQNFSSAPALFAAWLCGVKVRICHSHNYIKDVKYTFMEKLLGRANIIFATDLWACDAEAGNYLYGSSWNPDGNIIINAIKAEKYAYNPAAAQKLREEMNLEGKTVFLQISRMTDPKNHIFSLNFFNLFYEKNKDSYLIFLGKGELEDGLKKAAKEMPCHENVSFLGELRDVESYYSLADVLLMPSKFEGFGMVAVEAQAAGDYVVASEFVPKLTKITDNIFYLPLEPEAWMKTVNMLNFEHDRKIDVPEAFRIEYQSKIWEQKLLSRV